MVSLTGYQFEVSLGPFDDRACPRNFRSYTPCVFESRSAATPLRCRPTQPRASGAVQATGLPHGHLRCHADDGADRSRLHVFTDLAVGSYLSVLLTEIERHSIRHRARRYGSILPAGPTGPRSRVSPTTFRLAAVAAYCSQSKSTFSVPRLGESAPPPLRGLQTAPLIVKETDVVPGVRISGTCRNAPVALGGPNVASLKAGGSQVIGGIGVPGVGCGPPPAFGFGLRRRIRSAIQEQTQIILGVDMSRHRSHSPPPFSFDSRRSARASVEEVSKVVLRGEVAALRGGSPPGLSLGVLTLMKQNRKVELRSSVPCLGGPSPPDLGLRQSFGGCSLLEDDAQRVLSVGVSVARKLSPIILDGLAFAASAVLARPGIAHWCAVVVSSVARSRHQCLQVASRRCQGRILGSTTRPTRTAPTSRRSSSRPSLSTSAPPPTDQVPTPTLAMVRSPQLTYGAARSATGTRCPRHSRPDSWPRTRHWE